MQTSSISLLASGALATALLAASGVRTSPETKPVATSGGPLSAHIERKVRARTVAWFTADADAYARYTSESFVWNGVPVRRPFEFHFPDGRPWEISDFRVSTSGPTALVTYTLTEYLNYEEGAPFDRRRRTETWVQEGGRWKAASAESHEDCTSRTGRFLCY